MEQLKLLVIFASVLKHGSMNAAAPQLGMTASAVSQHIKKLEQHYQVKLLNRTTRKLTPTAEGKILWQYAQEITDLLEKTSHAMHHLQAEAVGEVKITLPNGYGQTHAIVQTLLTIRERYPAIRLTLIEDNQFDDLLNPTAADIALRAVPQPDNENLIARSLATWQTVICASPNYLAQYPINKPQDLLGADWLNFQDSVLLDTFAALGLPQVLPTHRIDCINNTGTARALAKAGLGLAILLLGDIDDELKSGQLVNVLPDIRLPTRTIYAVTVNRVQSAKVRAVLAVLAEIFGENLV